MTTGTNWTVRIASCPRCRGPRAHTVTNDYWSCQVCGCTDATPAPTRVVHIPARDGEDNPWS